MKYRIISLLFLYLKRCCIASFIINIYKSIMTSWYK